MKSTPFFQNLTGRIETRSTVFHQSPFKRFILHLFFLFLFFGTAYGQGDALHYELDLTRDNDSFNVTITNLELDEQDQIFSFVSFAPGVHQPLDFGRFVKLFKAFDKEGSELIVNKISINDFRLLTPEQVAKIVYEIDDSFDMSIEHHPIYPMSGTGITDNYAIVNSHGVFGYFKNLKSKTIELEIKVKGTPKIGTALSKIKDNVYLADSYYHLADSPLLIGDGLTYSSTVVGGIRVEAFVYSPLDELNADRVLKEADPVLKAAMNFIGFAPVDRYTFLMYFNDGKEVSAMPVLRFGGALEHSLSSTYALPADPSMLPFLKNVIAHEFMHILCPLHLRSEILANVDYSRPVSEDLHVWLYEGVTEWASFAMQVRNGNLGFDAYLNYLSEKINNSAQYDQAYSLTRISEEWHTDEGHEQYGNIYQLGALTAAMLDIELIRLSDGKKGLREVYLELIKTYGKENPFENATFFDEFVTATYPEIKTFIENHIKKNTPFDFEAAAAVVGLNYYPKKKNPKGLPSMGLHIDANSEGKAEIKSISDEYMGSRLQVGDQVVRINGIELVDYKSYKQIMNSIEQSGIGDSYEIEILRGDQKMTLEEPLGTKYERHVFELDPEASEQAKFRRKRLMPGEL